MSSNRNTYRQLPLYCILVALSILVCYSPNYAEESFNEKTEQVEECVVLISKKQVPELLISSDYLVNLDLNQKDLFITNETLAHSAKSKLFLLHESLRFCD